MWAALALCFGGYLKVGDGAYFGEGLRSQVDGTADIHIYTHSLVWYIALRFGTFLRGAL